MFDPLTDMAWRDAKPHVRAFLTLARLRGMDVVQTMASVNEFGHVHARWLVRELDLELASNGAVEVVKHQIDVTRDGAVRHDRGVRCFTLDEDTWPNFTAKLFSPWAGRVSP